jgi:transposase
MTQELRTTRKAMMRALVLSGQFKTRDIAAIFGVSERTVFLAAQQSQTAKG